MGQLSLGCVLLLAWLAAVCDSEFTMSDPSLSSPIARLPAHIVPVPLLPALIGWGWTSTTPFCGSPGPAGVRRPSQVVRQQSEDDFVVLRRLCLKLLLSLTMIYH